MTFVQVAFGAPLYVTVLCVLVLILRARTPRVAYVLFRGALACSVLPPLGLALMRAAFVERVATHPQNRIPAALVEAAANWLPLCSLLLAAFVGFALWVGRRAPAVASLLPLLAWGANLLGFRLRDLSEFVPTHDGRPLMLALFFALYATVLLFFTALRAKDAVEDWDRPEPIAD